MKTGNPIISAFSSYKTSILLLALYGIGLALATLIEKQAGTPVAKQLIYYSPAFILLQVLLVANFVMAGIKHNLFTRGKAGFMLVHFSLIIILSGAFITHLWSVEGSIHLREGQASRQVLIRTNTGSWYHELPFSVELVKFTLIRYPGSSAPSSYQSLIKVSSNDKTDEKVISMNNILDIDGYRLFQASYDKDEKGSILSVNKDAAGRRVTYIGYILLIAGFVLCFISPKSRFSRLSRQLRDIKNNKIAFLILGLTFFSLSANSQDTHLNIDKDHAGRFGALPMLSSSGRIEPINTFSSEIARKLSGSEKVLALSPDQFLLSLMAMPDQWIHTPIIKVKNKDIPFHFDLSDNACTYAELFDTNDNYKLAETLVQIHQKPLSHRTRFDKDVIKLDEQANILYQLIQHRLPDILPGKGDSLFVTQALSGYLAAVRTATNDNNWAKADSLLQSIEEYQAGKSQSIGTDYRKIEAELIYNKLDIFRLCKIAYLILGGCLLVASFASLFRPGRWSYLPIRILTISVIAVFIAHISGLILRGYIAGHAPWSNGYETMIYISLTSVAAGLLFVRRNSLTFALATLFAGITLFVSGLNWMDPQIGTLVPVLKSPWLVIHVAVIVAAYGFFGISCLLGITNLALLSAGKKGTDTVSGHVGELTIINEMSLWIGLALMTAGTFFGAIWANESWGRYWGWDPKETWALITIVVYTIVTHLHLIQKRDEPFVLNLASVLAFSSVLMTYFGVNLLLSGMHSYN